jgi:N-methylhydantoinase B
MSYQADPVTMQVIRYAMEQIADEMGYTLVRTSRSTIIKEIMDITCAVFDEKGNTIAQAHHAPMLLTGFEITMRELTQRFRPKDLEEGDVIVANDPYMGGQHIMDLQAFAPVFFGGELVGWVGSIAHHSDFGGASPGGVAGGMTEIYQEGLRLPMIKLYKRGKEDADLFNLVANNIRIPDKTLGDIRAQAASNYVGLARLKEVFAKYGKAVVKQCTAMLLDYSEGRIRANLKRVPNGRYSGVDYVDDDGVSDSPIKIQVNLEKKNDRARVDFDGTDEQVRGNVNCPLATTHAAVYYALIAVVDPHVPPNSGCYRPVTIEAKEGLVVNPRMPAAVAARTNTSQKITEAMLMALSSAVPDRVMAGSHAQITTCGFSGYYQQTGKRFVYTDVQGGGAGGRPFADGREGQDSHLARFMNTPIEAVELEYPVRIECYQFLADSAGAGRYRGALGLRRDTRIMTDEVTLARYGDRQKFPPKGMAGGKDGRPGIFYLNLDSNKPVPMRSKGMDRLKKGDLFSVCLPGGGGYGPPFERDPELVLQDVKDGKVSLEAAKRDYGVVIDPKRMVIKTSATQKLRGGKNKV